MFKLNQRILIFNFYCFVIFIKIILLFIALQNKIILHSEINGLILLHNRITLYYAMKLIRQFYSIIEKKLYYTIKLFR